MISPGNGLWVENPVFILMRRGRNRLALVAESLKIVPFRKIYSSPLERAVETAEPLAQKLGKEIIILDSLAELDFGDWTGKSLRSLRKLPDWKSLMTDPEWRFPGGESLPEVRKPRSGNDR